MRVDRRSISRPHILAPSLHFSELHRGPHHGRVLLTSSAPTPTPTLLSSLKLPCGLRTHVATLRGESSSSGRSRRVSRVRIRWEGAPPPLVPTPPGKGRRSSMRPTRRLPDAQETTTTLLQLRRRSLRRQALRRRPDADGTTARRGECSSAASTSRPAPSRAPTHARPRTLTLRGTLRSAAPRRRGPPSRCPSRST
jgi:hypothetical protein